jgi:hypothetical protein
MARLSRSPGHVDPGRPTAARTYGPDPGGSHDVGLRRARKLGDRNCGVPRRRGGAAEAVRRP